jgi:hypothetical protein
MINHVNDTRPRRGGNIYIHFIAISVRTAPPGCPVISCPASSADVRQNGDYFDFLLRLSKGSWVSSPIIWTPGIVAWLFVGKCSHVWSWIVDHQLDGKAGVCVSGGLYKRATLKKRDRN